MGSPLRQSLADARERSGIALVPFVPAGYPDVETTSQCIESLDRAGAGAIEIGFPFSDPIADGPIIQEAFTAALAAGVKVANVLSIARSTAAACRAPLVGMLSYSIVFRYGVERFARDARASGFAGLILPDLPPPEAKSACEVIRASGLDTILLVAPTTSPERRREIARLSSGFIYYLSVSGVTGERDRLPDDVERNVRELKAMTDVPVCVGFGIHRREQVRQLEGFADGAIVGSALVRRMKQIAADGTGKVGQAIGECLSDLTQSRARS